MRDQQTGRMEHPHVSFRTFALAAVGLGSAAMLAVGLSVANSQGQGDLAGRLAQVEKAKHPVDAGAFMRDHDRLIEFVALARDNATEIAQLRAGHREILAAIGRLLTKQAKEEGPP